MRGVYNVLRFMLVVCFTLKQPSEILSVVAGVRFPFRGGKSVRLLTNPETMTVMMKVVLR